MGFRQGGLDERAVVVTHDRCLALRRSSAAGNVASMIRRVVVFRWTAEATEEQKQQVAAGLRRLPALLPVLRAYQVGPDLGLAEGNFDFAVVADFDDLEGLQVYRDNPEHRAGPRSPATGNRPAGARRCAEPGSPTAAQPGPGQAKEPPSQMAGKDAAAAAKPSGKKAKQRLRGAVRDRLPGYLVLGPSRAPVARAVSW
jgi:hypothetical protein